MRARLALVLAVLPLTLAAQRPVVTGALARALAAERRGDLADAVTEFEAVLAERPADGQAILGLSRVLPALDRRAELVAPLRQALAIDSSNVGFLAMAVRTFALLGRGDSAAAYVNRWVEVVGSEEEPWREWATSALEAHDRVGAKRALEEGRRRIANPAALAPELAQLREAEGDIPGATDEWLRAIDNAPTLRNAALLMLGDLLPPRRDTVLAVLARRGDDPEATRLRGLLLVKWGQPEQGVAIVGTVLPESAAQASYLLRPVLEELKGRDDRPALRAKGQALELQASREEGLTRVRTWMDAARAWADAGEERIARRILADVAADPAAPDGVASAASGTLLGVLIAEGQPAQAESLLVSIRGALSLDERDRATRRVAMAWARADNIAHAEAMLENDSSVSGFAVRGRLRAYLGDLVDAAEWLKAAGPYDDEQEHAVERVALLSLLGAMDRDTFPAFGRTLLILDRGDTATAVTRFTALADSLAPPGAAALRYLAGELALSRADTAAALSLLAAADTAVAPATAPAARLARARIAAARGERTEAERLLEAIIIDYPDSAAVPDARRLRDLLHGAIPTGAAT